MANHRTGIARGHAGQKGGSHTRAWRDDDVILARIERVAEMRLRGKRVNDIAEALAISRDTVYDDLNRWYEFQTEKADDAKARAQARLELVIRDLNERIEETQSSSLNKSAYYGQLLRAIEMDGKLAGLFRDKVEVTGKDGGPIELANAAREQLASRIAELAARDAAQPADSESE